MKSLELLQSASFLFSSLSLLSSLHVFLRHSLAAFALVGVLNPRMRSLSAPQVSSLATDGHAGATMLLDILDCILHRGWARVPLKGGWGFFSRGESTSGKRREGGQTRFPEMISKILYSVCFVCSCSLIKGKPICNRLRLFDISLLSFLSQDISSKRAFQK